MYSDPTAVLKMTLESVSSPWCVELFSQTLLSCFLSFQVSPVRTSVLYWAPPRIEQNKNIQNTRLQWREENTVIIQCSEKVFQKLLQRTWLKYINLEELQNHFKSSWTPKNQSESHYLQMKRKKNTWHSSKWLNMGANTFYSRVYVIWSWVKWQREILSAWM